MGQAKAKKKLAFSDDLIESWEREKCLNFAVALARETNWLLHVDSWIPNTDPDSEIAPDDLHPLRVYVADNHELVFDVRGIKSLFDFTHRTVHPLAIVYGNGAIKTRYYSEETLRELVHLPSFSEEKIEEARKEILRNEKFLDAIPKRKYPLIPAYTAAQFTFGKCAVYAQALGEMTGLKAVALLATRFHQKYGGEKNPYGKYVHSFVMHPDGMGEDVWGIAPVNEIAARFGVSEYLLSEGEQMVICQELSKNTPERFTEFSDLAKSMLQKYRSS